jgi:large subunit ribosomal protein L25
MPDSIPLSLEGTEIGATLRVSDLAVPESVKVLADPETVIATVSAPKLAAELEAAEAELAELAELAEGEELPEGEEPAEAPAAEGDAPAESDAGDNADE